MAPTPAKLAFFGAAALAVKSNSGGVDAAKLRVTAAVKMTAGDSLKTKVSEFKDSFKGSKYGMPQPTKDLVDKLENDTSLKTANRWAKYAAETRPYITENVETLLLDVMEAIEGREKELYNSRNMDLKALVTRLLSKRPFTFWESYDEALLRDGSDKFQ